MLLISFCVLTDLTSKIFKPPMTSAAVRSKAMILLLMIHCLLLLPLCRGFMFKCKSFVLDPCFVLSVFTSFAITLLRKRELVALLKLCSYFHVVTQSENLGTIRESSIERMKGVVLCKKKLHFVSRNWRKEN